MPAAAMEFLEKSRKESPPPLLVAFGDSEFLRREVYLAIREWVVGPDPDDFTLTVYEDSEIELRDVLDELFTPPMLGDRRLVVVESAEDFVSQNREALLRYSEAPSASGSLLLNLKTWRSNTKLAKAVEQSGLAIESKAPKDWHVPGWCVKWAKRRYGKTLSKATAEWLVDLAGSELGPLDQQLGKLADYVGDRDEIDVDAVNRMVVGVRTTTIFKLLDMALEGKSQKAATLLERQLAAGEAPIMIMAGLTSQLRRLTQAARLITEEGLGLRTALEEVGTPAFALDKSEQQLRRLGRERMAQMYRRLLAADLDLKGGSALDARILVERFFVELVAAS